MKTLLLIPGATEDRGDAAPQPVTEYEALAAALDRPGVQDADGLHRAGENLGATRTDRLDYRAVDGDTRPLVRLTRRLAGRDAALALLGFLQRERYDVIFTGGEAVGLPLALLLGLDRNRPGHVTVGRRLSAGRPRLGYTLLRAHRQMDAIFVYAQSQMDFAEDRLRVPADQLRLIASHVDDHFFRPPVDAPVPTSRLGVAGDSGRDDSTFQDALAGTSGLHAAEIGGDSPQRRRDLYADSCLVAVPLRDSDSPGGVTAILEAMAMGKAVVATRTTGLPDVILDGETGLSVPPGDVEGWREAITRLRSDDTLRARLGRNARLWVERHATLTHWVGHVVTALEDCARPRPAPRPQADPVEEVRPFPVAPLRAA